MYLVKNVLENQNFAVPSLQRRPCVDGRIPTPPKMGLVWTAGFPPLLKWALCGQQDSHPS